MRIISGEFKGRPLIGPKGKNIRPSSDRLRESVFNLLSHRGLRWQGTWGLDLFAGTGALGMEALSRGASKVIGVEQDKEAIALIQKNCATLGITDEQYQIFPMSVAHWLSKAPEPSCRCQWAFLDPPYAHGKTPEVMKTLDQRVPQYFEPGAMIVLEVAAKHSYSWDQEAYKHLEYIVSRQYGNGQVHIWRSNI